MSLNVVVISGNLTADPEVRVSQGGTKIAKFRMAINDKYTNTSGVTTEKTHYVACTAFGKTAEVVGSYVHKGQRIEVQGKLDYSEWTDEKTEQRRSNLGVIALQVSLLPKAMNPKPSQRPADEHPGLDEEPGEAVLSGAAKAGEESDDIPF